MAIALLAALYVPAAPGQSPPTATAAPPPATDADTTIVVTARHLQVETLVDRKVYHVGDDVRGTSGSAADLLTAIPSVEVDADGIVALRGETSVLILVDGRPQAQLSGPLAGDALQQMAAQDIERIEVITNPSAQYKAEGIGGIINIITRRSHRQGWSGGANASAGNDRRYQLGSNGDYRNQDLHLSAALGLRQDDRQRQILSTETVPYGAGSGVLRSQSELDEHIRRRLPQAKLGIEYALDERRSLTASAVRGGRTGERTFTQDTAAESAPGVPGSAGQRDSVGREWSMDSDRRISFDQKFADPEETLRLTAHRSTFHEREYYTYTNFTLLPPAAPTQDGLDLSEDQASNEFGVDYARPLGDGRRLKVGANLQADDNTYGNAADTVDPVSGARIVNAALTNEFRYLQRVGAAYASLESAAGAWTVLTGLRLEQTHSDARQITDASSMQRGYRQAFPSVHADYTLSEAQTVSLSAGRRIARPDAGALNPYVDRQDIHNLRAGNPGLLPQVTLSFELGYAVETKERSYGLTGYLRKSHDSVTDLAQALAPDVVLTTKVNLPRSNAAGLEFLANGHLTPALRYALSGNVFYSQIDATALGAPGLASTRGINAKASLDYRSQAAGAWQLSATRSDKRLTPQGYVGAINIVNAGCKYPLRTGLDFVTTLSDLFNGQTLVRTASSPALSDTYRRHVGGHLVYAGLVYHFGAGTKAKAEGFEYSD